MAVKLIIKPFLYDQVSMNVEVDSEYKLKRIDSGLGGFLFEEVHVEKCIKDLSEYELANNIEKFEGEDFCFYLTQDEYKNLMSKKSTSSWGGRRKPPRAFTESGVYMLMTVLRGELATKQSRALINTFGPMG